MAVLTSNHCLTETKPQDLDLLELVGQKNQKNLRPTGGEFNGEKSHGRIGSTVFQVATPPQTLDTKKRIPCQNQS